MFFVFNRQKIFSYFIAFTTVAILLGIANIFNGRIEEPTEIASTSSAVYSDEMSSSFIINDDMEESDIETIIQIARKYNMNIKFCCSNKWENQHNQMARKIEKMGYALYEL